MGDSHFFEGTINIEPPLNFAEIKKAQTIALELVGNSWSKKHAKAENVFEGHMPLKFFLDVFEKDTDEGPLTVTRAYALVPSHTSDGSNPYLMKGLVEALIKGLPGHNWAGQVMSIDEYRRSAVRIDVVTGPDVSTVTEVHGKGTVVWDDKSQTEISAISD